MSTGVKLKSAWAYKRGQSAPYGDELRKQTQWPHTNPDIWQAWWFDLVSGIIANGIPSAAAFGAPTLMQNVAAAGIASAEATGSPTIVVAVSATGIASGEVLGAPGAALVLQPSGVATGYLSGTPALAAVLEAAGLASGAAFGTPGLAQNLVAVGIGTTEAFGEPSVSAGHYLTAVGIASGFVAGTPTLTRDYIISRIVKDRNKLPVYGANCYLFVTYSKQFVDQATTDTTGRYHFHVANQIDEHFVVTFKDGTPPLAGVSVNTLVGA